MSSPGSFQSILVPLDGSPLAEQAIPVALAIAERAGSKVRLVLVHQELSPLLLMESAKVYATNLLAIQASESDYLEALTGRLRKRLGRALSSAVIEGPVASTLAEYIRDIGADLVVMTTHGRGGIRRAWLGSVTDQLIRTLQVPVLAVRAREGAAVTERVSVPEILVPLDGSPLAEAVLEPAAALARLWGAKVSLVQIVQPVLPATDPALPFPSGYDEQLTAIRRDLAQDYLRDMAEGLREQGIEATGVAVLGGATADTLLDLARSERVGLVALATHGRGGVRRLALGSVADKLVRAADMPVLVVRPSGKRAKRVRGDSDVAVPARAGMRAPTICGDELVAQRGRCSCS
jgi:nucleotide-binding universal stress UspA family protein